MFGVQDEIGKNLDECGACNEELKKQFGSPVLTFKNIRLCLKCYTELIIPIFEMGGAGDGGIINILFKECVGLNYNLKRKKKPVPIAKLNKRIAKYFQGNC